MKLVYVAGPYRGADNWQIKQNINRAATLALEVWRLGAACICPHLNTADFQNAAPDDLWLRGDIEMLRRCDAVLMTDDWARSLGATEERAYVRRTGLPVFYALDELAEWLLT